ncbi:hypothetical protein JCM10295v2_001968 [Rhodotorula toruloides]
MGVNQHLRQLAKNKLVRHFRQQAVPLVKPGSFFMASRMSVGAGLIRLRPCVYPDRQLGLGLPINDPRELFRSDFEEFKRFVVELEEIEAELEKEEAGSDGPSGEEGGGERVEG